MRWTRQSVAAALPVAVVAIVAAIVSFGHIETLALSVHQPLADARLLPFAVDALIVAGSVILLAGSRLGWLCVVSGVSATLFANVESGVRFGPLAATVAAWPAVAFTIASFVLERWLARSRTSVPVPAAVHVPVSAPVHAPVPVSAPVPVPESVPAASNGHDADVSEFADEIASGTVPGIRTIRDRMKCGQPRATELQSRIKTLVLLAR